MPDRTLLLVIEPGTGRARSQKRGAPPDRLEQQPDAFFATIAAAYAELARADPGRFRTIDATRAPGAVLGDALTAIEDLI